MSCLHTFSVNGVCRDCGVAFPALGTSTRLSFQKDLEPRSYTDDIIDVMRSTIEAQRETIAAKDALIDTQRAHIADLRARLGNSPLPEGM